MSSCETETGLLVTLYRVFLCELNVSSCETETCLSFVLFSAWLMIAPGWEKVC